MPTHYHMLVNRVAESKQTSEVFKTSEVLNAKLARVSLAMMRLSVSYTKAINKRFSRVGALFQGQFQAKSIRSYSHLLNVCIYIHANPVRDRLVAAPTDWPYSNYLEWMGEREGTLLDPEFICEHFDTPTAYRALVSEYLQTRRLPQDVRLYLQTLEK